MEMYTERRITLQKVGKTKDSKCWGECVASGVCFKTYKRSKSLFSCLKQRG